MKMLLVVALVVLALAPARAEDLTGRLGVGGSVGASSPVGDKWVSDRNDTGLGLGAWLRYGLSPRWSVGAGYDNLAFSRGTTRLEVLDANAAYALMPESSWNPNLHAGFGAGWISNDPTGKVRTVATNLGFGLDKFVLPCVSVGAVLDWFYAPNAGRAVHDVNAVRTGVTAGFWFGGKREPKAAPTPVTYTAPKPAPAPAAAPAPAPAPAPVAAPVPAPAEKVTIALDLEFDTAKSVVKPQYDAELKKVADFMKTYPTTKAEIEGHTDNVGQRDYNKALSQRRADAVRQALIDRFGADASRLTAKGYGEEKPLVDNSTAEGRAQNRRVVATFTATK
jgi:OOP family OmpA-OmpF porin